ncbi:MAG: type IX secretion system sortase PorU [Muribaculaceae bacterium]|nr:type IX secretion system sortase PorU [Muribaculaceae bacterium]
MIKLQRHRITTLLALVMWAGALLTNAFPTSHYASQSKLASGKWARVQVWESGIYELTQASLAQMGFHNMDSVKVYGAGGAPLSEALTADIPDDLPQVPVIRLKDRILFYAQGLTTWTSLNDKEFRQRLHPYATEAFYFITDQSGDTNAKPQRASHEIGGTPFTTFIEHLYHEEEMVNPGQTGRNLLGEDLMNGTGTVTVQFDLPGRVPNSDVTVRTRTGSKLISGSFGLKFSYNNQELPTSRNDSYSQTSANSDYYNLLDVAKTFTLEGTNELNYTVTAQKSGTLNVANLDFITVNYQRNLALTDGQLRFTQNQYASSNVQYVISGATDSTHVWDVTVPYAPIEMNTRFEDGKLMFSPSQSGHREYVVFDENGTFEAAEHQGNPSNQDLHGAETPDMIIITNSQYNNPVNRLAKFHSEHDDMKVMVVTPNKVYNEFSSGIADAMAYRMLCKMMWDRGVDTAGHHLQYLLLMGDGTYDNKLMSKEVRSLQKYGLLTWQTEDSNTESGSYSTDDCFGILADDASADFTTGKLDIAVGRYPVSKLTEATAVVDKLIKYMGSPDYGSWKNNALIVADDQDNATHMSQAEDLITTSREHGGQDMVYTHVFIDAFPVTSVGAARTFPEAKALMMNKLQEGVLWWNYTGHASPNNWGAEGMLRRNDITDNLYYDHLPVLYAATCSFAKFDALLESGTESMVLNPRGGAIAVISAAREVLMNSNGPLNQSVAKYIYSLDKDGKQYRLGDILRLGKNENTNGKNKLKYFLFGDPALRLAIPENRAVIRTINGIEVNSENRPTFQGRQTITLEGSIVDRKGEKLSDFNGNIQSTLFDSEQSVTTNGYGDGTPFTYLDRPNKLAMAIDTVTSGDFSIKITIPSELMATYENYSPSLINLYAYDMTNNLEATGSNSDFYIYGYDDTAVTDTIGPEISFFGLNSSEFVDGSAVNESPLVLATISDESGVNFSTAGVGHNITLVLDGTKTYSELTPYYTPLTCDEGTLGTISFPLSELENGEHSLRLRVWDVLNNVSEKTIRFSVSRGLKPEVAEVYATSNPAKTSTTFYVKHNRPNAQMNVGIQVFDLMGRMVWSTQQSGKCNQFMTFPITWDLNMTSGNRAPRGIYIYRATISTDGEHEASKAKKLAITAE